MKNQNLLNILDAVEQCQRSYLSCNAAEELIPYAGNYSGVDTLELALMTGVDLTPMFKYWHGVYDIRHDAYVVLAKQNSPRFLFNGEEMTAYRADGIFYNEDDDDYWWHNQPRCFKCGRFSRDIPVIYDHHKQDIFKSCICGHEWPHTPEV